MTDWLPWGATLMVGTFATLAATLRAVGRARGAAPDLRLAWWLLAATVATSLGVYTMYLLYGESWVWYLR